MEGLVIGHQVFGKEQEEEERDGEAEAFFADAVFIEEAGKPDGDDQRKERNDGEDVMVEFGGGEGKEKVGEEKGAEEEVVTKAKLAGEVAPRPLHKAEEGDGDHGRPREEAEADLADIEVEAIVGFFDHACDAGEVVIDKPFAHKGEAVMVIHVKRPRSCDDEEDEDTGEKEGFEVFKAEGGFGRSGFFGIVEIGQHKDDEEEQARDGEQPREVIGVA